MLKDVPVPIEKTKIFILAAVRATNVITFKTQGAHGFRAGFSVVISGTTVTGATVFDDTYTIKAITDAYNFTVDDVADNDTATAGTASEIVLATHPTATALGGVGIEAAAATTGTTTLWYYNVAPMVQLTLTIGSSNGGTHYVWTRSIN